MVIANQPQMQQWIDQNVHVTVRDWFESNNGKWISDCVTAKSLTYSQVAWALGFIANNTNQVLMALPENDSELSLSMQLNQMYG